MTPSPAGRTVLSVVGATAALGAATLAYSLIEARCPVLRRIDVPVLAPDEKPLTVLHLADLHLTGHTEARVAVQVTRGQTEHGGAVVVVAHDEGTGQVRQWLQRPPQRLQPGGQGQVVAGVDDDIGP